MTTYAQMDLFTPFTMVHARQSSLTSDQTLKLDFFAAASAGVVNRADHSYSEVFLFLHSQCFDLYLLYVQAILPKSKGLKDLN